MRPAPVIALALTAALFLFPPICSAADDGPTVSYFQEFDDEEQVTASTPTKRVRPKPGKTGDGITIRVLREDDPAAVASATGGEKRPGQAREMGEPHRTTGIERKSASGLPPAMPYPAPAPRRVSGERPVTEHSQVRAAARQATGVHRDPYERPRSTPATGGTTALRTAARQSAPMTTGILSYIAPKQEEISALMDRM